MRHAVWTGLVLAAVAVLVAVALFVRVRDLSAEGAALVPSGAAAAADAREEKVVGVVSRLAPSTLYEGYQPILDYLSRATPYHFRLRASRGYRDAVEDLVAGRTQASFLGSLLYVEARAVHGVEPLVRPRNARGEPVSESLVVVLEDSPIRNLEGLARRVVAVPPADSLSANWLWRAAPAGLQFRTVSYGHHEAVVRSVLRGLSDAGVVKERVAVGHLGSGLRVLARSGPVPSAPARRRLRSRPRLRGRGHARAARARPVPRGGPQDPRDLGSRVRLGLRARGRSRLRPRPGDATHRRRVAVTGPFGARSTLRGRLLVATGGTVTVLLLVVFVVVLLTWRSRVVRDLETSALAVSRAFSVSALETLLDAESGAVRAPERLDDYIEHLMRDEPRVRSVRVYDASGSVVAASSPPDRATVSPAAPFAGRKLTTVYQTPRWGWVVETNLPLRTGGRDWGLLEILYDAGETRRELTSLYTMLGAGTLGVVAALLLVSSTSSSSARRSP